jgi:hypothetical protein
MQGLAEAGNAGVVDKDVQPAKSFLYALNEGGHGIPIGNIAGQSFALTASGADLPGGVFQMGEGASAYHNRGAQSGQTAGDPGADTAATSGYQRDFLSQLGHGCISLCVFSMDFYT